MVVIESFPEMGGPYPLDRDGPPRVLSSPVADRRVFPDDHRVVHPSWPPQAPRVLSPEVEERARKFDQMMRNYNGT